MTDFYDYLLNILNPAIKHDKKLLKSTRQNKEILDFNPRSKLKTDEKPENSFLEGDSLFDSKADHKIDFFLENFSETNSEIDFLDNDSFDPPKDNISDLCLRQISISLLQKIKIRHISAKKIQKAYRNYRLKTVKNIIKGSIDHALINYDRHVYNEVKEHFENIMTKILDEYEAWEIDKFHSVRRNTRVMNQRRTDVIQKLRNNRTTVRSE